ncbi:papain-like cysteine peptidase [Aureimonas altamirensis]|uniref:DUF1796 family putative cysteine peptidase n=1 Tax=Aureimonas altamirensis TaxID=370622 RepID=UPI001E44C38A|nr:DUF1796 family putative cysteine peptidase [Aureimonas altamirensis]UHD44070.1 papain-like cysteine peptidase [Aureimonas altamirensis]
MYKYVISLGGACMVAYQIHQNFDQPISYPFDWLITPFSALTPLLKANFQNFAALDDMSPAPDGKTIINERWGIQHVHDVATVNGALPENWREVAKSSLVGKFSYLVNRYHHNMSAGGPILFVRHRGHVDLFGGGSRYITIQEANSLALAITRRYPGLEFRLALVNCLDPSRVNFGANGTQRRRRFSPRRLQVATKLPFANDRFANWIHPELHPSIDTHEVDYHDAAEWPDPDDRWRGCSRDWKRVFDQYKPT